MNSIELLRLNLVRSTERTLARVGDMRDHALTPPTSRGGGHTLWVLGHLAYVEGLVVRRFLLGEKNPLASWEAIFDGDAVRERAIDHPPFDEVLETCRGMRRQTMDLLDSQSEADLDRASRAAPKGYDDLFGTRRLCLQYAADHWLMHRGQLADARRAAGVDRMWL